jgi:urea-proton symporter
MLAGNVAALCSPLIFIPVLTYAFGKQNYDWKSMWEIRKVDDSSIMRRSSVDPERRSSFAVHQQRVKAAAEEAASDAEQVHLAKSAKIARTITVFMALALLIIWPMPMYGSGYIFSEKFFTGWVVVGILWLFCSIFAVGLYPLYQGRKTSARTIHSMFLDMFGKWQPPRVDTIEGEGNDSDEAVVVEEKNMGIKSR